MEFRILGPLEVADMGKAIRLDAPKQRALLGVLLLHPNEVVSSERLIDELWGERPPATARKLVQTYVSQLRHALGREFISTRSPGYLLRAEDDALDATRFRLLAAEGRRLVQSGQLDRAAASYRDALALWRGPPLTDVVLESFAQNEVHRLADERLGVLLDRIDCELALGQHDRLVGELEALVGQYPLRERLHSQLMLALYRSGRQADALAAYQNARRSLVEELGLEPSRELHELEQAILTHDTTLEPPPAAAPEQTNLPIQPTSFLGREREVGEVLALLRRPELRLVTLTGAGGSGKTRLALEAAVQLVDDYPHGVWWVPLAALHDPQLVLESVAQVFGVKDELARHIADRRMLLLLDNFEHLAEAAPGVADLLAACSNLNMLVTSRERLHLAGEHEYLVAPLTEAEAVALFQQRGGPAAREVGVDAVVEICRRVDRLPLAVELAAARVKFLPVHRILERLATRLPLLTGGPRDAPERQRTLGATIQWSYDLLDDEESDLFGRLAVFVGGFTLDSADEVCGASLDRVQALIDKSLLRREGERYAMLETVREFALDRLEASGEAEDVRARHAEHFLVVAESEGPYLRAERQSVALDHLEAEHGNMRAALAWSGDIDAHMQLRLTVALGHFWLVRGYLAEGGRWFHESLARSAQQQDSLRINALCRAANLAWMHMEDEKARLLARESLALARALGDIWGIASSLVPLAIVALLGGDYEKAGSLFEQSDELFREVGDTWERALSSSNLADAARTQGDYGRAEALYDQALAGFEELGDPRMTAWVRCNLGFVALRQNHIRLALQLLQEALARSRALRDREATAYILEGLAAVAVRVDETEKAVRLMGAADVLLKQLGARFWPFERRLHKESLGTAKARLEEPKFSAAWVEGRSMSLDGAIDYALGLDRPETVSESAAFDRSATPPREAQGSDRRG